MIEIGSLSLTLPPGFGVRAESIARLTATEIGRSAPGPRGAIDRVDAGTVSVRAGAHDVEIARAVAAAVHAQLGGPR